MIKKGPYPFIEYKKKNNDLCEKLNKLKYKKLLNTKFLFVLLTIILIFDILLLFTSSMLLMYKILIIIAIFGLIPLYYLTSIKLYHIKTAKIHENIKNLRYHFNENTISIPITEIINHIEVYYDIVTIPPLSKIDKRYYYDPDFYNPIYDDVSQRFWLHEDKFWKEYYLTASFSSRRYELTYDEYKLLKSKDLENF